MCGISPAARPSAAPSTITVTEQDRLLLLDVAVPPTHVDVLDAVAERAARVSGLAP